ncbi:C-terminal binding protein [Georgenia sp. Z1491]|uniref:C-terminal binding protein n=1 Tax=Georgenia sp. Z1491 TaxID=3416707 RepID=UPI003CEF8924
MSEQIIAVTDTAVDDETLERRLAKDEGATYRRWDGSGDLGAVLDGAHVVFTNFAPLGAAELDRLAPDAVVIRYGVGVDNVDLAAAAAAGVRVCNVPDYGAGVVADHATMLALMLVRRVREFDDALHDGSTMRAGDLGPIPSMESRVVGLVGAGRIARMAAERLRAFGATTIAYDPYLAPGALDEEQIRLVGWDELLASAHILSLHLPLTEDTHHLLDDAAFAAMGEGTFLINTARGGLVDHDALGRALDSGRLAGAALDVTEPEPLPTDHPLRSRPEVILTPHAAFYSTESMERLQVLAVDEARRALHGEPLRCPFPLPDVPAPRPDDEGRETR